MREGEAPGDPRLVAVHAFARAVALERGKVDDELVAALTASGHDTAQILEIVAECTFAGLVGTLDNLAGRVELDPFLAPRAWRP
jgi:alkylhydroperoxidase family enzyme